MCLIIQGNPKHFSEDIIKKAFNQNPHGFGLMYLNKKTNEIVIKKFFTKKINKILKVCKEHFKKADEIALHFRITTNGNTNNKNCHPFIILDSNKNDEIDCALMHNSPRLPAPLLNKKMSDTYYFSKIILRPILKNNYKLIENEKFIDCLESITQAEINSRVLLLDNFTKSFQFIGDWHEHKNLKYSNKNILPVPKYLYQKPIYHDWEDFEYKPTPKIKVQHTPSTTAVDSELITPKDLEDFSDLLNTADRYELVKIAKENPKLIADYILATHNGFDCSDLQDCELYFDENKTVQFNDLKPITKNN